MKPTILAVDNDVMVLTAMKMIFDQKDITLETASSGQQCLALFESDPDKYEIVLLDYHMKNKKEEGMNGDEVARKLKLIRPDVRVLIISGVEDDPEIIAACISAGVERFILKGSDHSDLLSLIRTMLSESQEDLTPLTEVERKQKISKTLKMVGRSAEMAKVADLISRFSLFDEPVLILGESGAGKEGIARAVHENSKRKSKKFVAINCAAFGKEVLESELFGHERGSFTGAIAKKIGLFEQADGGTIFLDEIGDMPLDLQVKILRALQEKMIQPVGGLAKKVDFRVVAATHCNLKLAAENNQFRQDLYYRLKYLTVSVPPLRERLEDIEPLVYHFVNQMNESSGMKKTISEGAIKKLRNYGWPGNVRDLEATVKKAYVLSDDKIFDEIFDGELDPNLMLTEVLGNGEIVSYKEFTKRMEEQERKLLNRAMELAGNVKSAAAALLEINHNTMNYRRELLGMKDKKIHLKKVTVKLGKTS